MGCRSSKLTQEKAFSEPKISILYNSIVIKADGDDVLSSITVKNTVTGEETVYKASDEDGMIGLFGFLGIVPETEIIKDTGIMLSESGHISAGENTHTNVSGVFAAGDIRTKELRQVVTAVSDGAVAAYEADKYLKQSK